MKASEGFSLGNHMIRFNFSFQNFYSRNRENGQELIAVGQLRDEGGLVLAVLA